MYFASYGKILNASVLLIVLKRQYYTYINIASSRSTENFPKNVFDLLIRIFSHQKLCIIIKYFIHNNMQQL